MFDNKDNMDSRASRGKEPLFLQFESDLRLEGGGGPEGLGGKAVLSYLPGEEGSVRNRSKSKMGCCFCFHSKWIG